MIFCLKYKKNLQFTKIMVTCKESLLRATKNNKKKGLKMAFINIDKEELKDLVKILEDSTLSEIRLTDGDARITLNKASSNTVASTPVAPASAPSGQTCVTTTVCENTKPSPENHPGALKSPMVGNAYLKPSPDSDNFVKVGDSVKEGDTILIIEAMKVMNPIKAEKSGTVKEICVSDAEPVEFDQVLAIIE